MQTKRQSITEAMVNVGTGMVIAWTISQSAVIVAPYIPGFTWDVGIGSNVIMTIILTVVSISRGYLWRRYFNVKHGGHRALRKRKSNTSK